MTYPVSSKTSITSDHSSDLELETNETTKQKVSKVSRLKVNLNAERVVPTWYYSSKRTNGSETPAWQDKAWSQWPCASRSTSPSETGDATSSSELSNSSYSSEDLSPNEQGIFNNIRFCLELILK
ncbi:MAG: hypothetical protein PVI40_01300 [Chlamydiota bacterium]|jgi:hypothetical protein